MSPSEVKAVLVEWLPDPVERAAVANLFARTIRRVHSNAPEGWEVTFRPGFGRLNVGQVAVLDWFPSEIAIYAMHGTIMAGRGFRKVKDWRGYKEFGGRHDRWLVTPSRVGNLSRGLLRLHDELVARAWAAKRRTPHRRHHTPSAVTAIAELSRIGIEQPGYVAVEMSSESSGKQSAFGNSETNPLVEAAAVALVTGHYKADGWSVVSRERDRCGYDLMCKRGRTVHHVEVKGRSGEGNSFVLTQRELACAESDPNFRFAVVAFALSHEARIQLYDLPEFESAFAVRPLQYIATKITSSNAT